MSCISSIFTSGSLHEKSLSHGDVSLNATNKSSTLANDVDSKLSLNETGWSTMSDVSICILSVVIKKFEIVFLEVWFDDFLIDIFIFQIKTL